MSKPAEIPAYLLSGGASRRFGCDKSLVEIDGQPQLQRIRNALAAEAASVEVVADAVDRYGHLGIACIADLTADAGPVGGLVTAMTDRRGRAGEGWLLLVSGDQLHWDTSWLSALLQHTSPLHEAVLFTDSATAQQKTVSTPRRWQPLPGLFHTRMLSPATEYLAEGKRSFAGLCERTRVRLVSTDNLPQRWSFNSLQELSGLLTAMKRFQSD